VPGQWDYLIVTAANHLQAASYEAQLELRRRVGQLSHVRHLLVVADFDGHRIGSGGSTIDCLRQVVALERGDAPSLSPEVALSKLRILILHAGGDSRRLPAYSPCGKVFVPLPGESYNALGSTLFDRIAPQFFALPEGKNGQIVVAAADALITFDPEPLRFSHSGITVLGKHATPEEASRHGVFCPDWTDKQQQTIRLFLQKPGAAELKSAGALDANGKAVLDVGVMSFDATAAASLLNTFCDLDTGDSLAPWKPRVQQALIEHGIDLYREICCSLGTESSLEHYYRAVRASGSKLDDGLLAQLFHSLRTIPLKLQMMAQCSFLHFGSTKQLISSGIALVSQDAGTESASSVLAMNNDLQSNGEIEGREAWVEGCRVSAPLRLDGRNVVTGADVTSPLALPEGACIDISEGLSRSGERTWFARCYGVDDTFKHSVQAGPTFCGVPLTRWIELVGASDIWQDGTPAEERTLWNARLFPAEEKQEGYRRWLWFFDVERATAEQKRSFLAADRYSAAEVATQVDQAAFHARRAATRAAEVARSLPVLFAAPSRFSSHDLAFTLERSENRATIVAGLLGLCFKQMQPETLAAAEKRASFDFCRIAHCLGAAIDELVDRSADEDLPLDSAVPGLAASLPEGIRTWSDANCLSLPAGRSARSWAARLRELAFYEINGTIVRSSLSSCERPRNALRPDETIWGRSPARIELAGGWTDTPPYTLERGGDVTNTAINLNGQPPIHCYCRVLDEPLIRLNAIDGGQRLEIRELAELVDYRRPGDPFALTKAALTISGFAPGMADWPEDITLREMLESFGGGIEITTIVGIPQGSGLGTSSILGAVILGVIGRMTGRTPNQKELFHDVLRLEQALTTGGGWQDQVGGCVGGTKITSTHPGLFPDARSRFVPSDVLDPKLNGGCTLLYYTGLTRIAKNILKEIVGGYLNRDHGIMDALAEEHSAARAIADTMARKDIAAFGAGVDAAWALQKRLCKTVTNPAIESLLDRVRPYVYGMRISGAGSGGFLLMICKSPKDAEKVRTLLENEPLNERSRFFDFEVNNVGLEVTTC
jgi:fucokinase